MAELRNGEPTSTAYFVDTYCGVAEPFRRELAGVLRDEDESPWNEESLEKPVRAAASGVEPVPYCPNRRGGSVFVAALVDATEVCSVVDWFRSWGRVRRYQMYCGGFQARAAREVWLSIAAASRIPEPRLSTGV